jgi:histidyl-tRNA synthetase
VGWAAGIERLAMMIAAPRPERPATVIVPLGEKAEVMTPAILASLRGAGIATDMAYRGNMKKRLSRANDAGAFFVLIIGDDEVERGIVSAKNLRTGEQVTIPITAVAEELKVRLPAESLVRQGIPESAIKLGGGQE